MHIKGELSERMAPFLEELQKMDEATKKRVIVIGTVIIMVIVVGIWVVYLNGIVMTPIASNASAGDAVTTTDATATVPAAPAPVAQSAPEEGPGANFWSGIASSFASIGNLFNRSADYSIQPK